ncbi:MAG TPA: hypothetical protein DIS79_06920 [Bacteroidetes bacterium]|nr:hypothetical protein [Bacteroidota bacterium]HRK05439.1 hypothetical protein [Chlorobiota bacterium]
MIVRHILCHHAQLIAHPVGDGNALELNSWGTAMMDCGGDARAIQVLHSAAARGMSEFLLTHLHFDHYSGISRQPPGTKLPFDVDQLFLPALPLIKDHSLTENFALTLFTMNKILGGKSGIPEQDLIDGFTSLNPTSTSPSHAFLSKGDSFDLAGIPFQVLWPPRVASDLVATSAKNAIDVFEKAIENNEQAKEIRERLRDQAAQAARRAVQRADEHDDRSADASQEEDSTDNEEFIDGALEIPETLINANRAIRRVANRLSLAFRCGTRLIHLGDLERAELNQVVTDLGPAKEFFGMIAAHHGTHFSSKMNRLRALHLVVSNGSRRPNLQAGYRKIARFIQETNVHGHSFLVF